MNEYQSKVRIFREGFLYRMSLQMRVQHIIFAVCMLVLTLTGLALLFYDTFFGQFLIFIQGGFESRGMLHRIAGFGLVFISLYHIAYSLLTRSGREDLGEKIIVRKDFTDFSDTIRYAMGRAENRPEIGKYSFGQKLHYWLASLFAFSMIITGLILFSPTTAMTIIPLWMIEIVQVIHGYEGMLVFVVLVLWHLYFIHLSPRNFPMSKVWLNGRMPLDEAEKFHRLEYQRIKELAEKDGN